MLGSVRARRWWLTVALLSLAALLSGCSGSSSASRSTDTASPPADDPPGGEDPTGEDPGGDTGDDPEVALSAADTVIPAGETAELTWSSSGADSCTASGGWSGARALSGSATVGPLDESTTFTLTCSGDGGNAVAMLSVGVRGVVTVEWQPPTENVDGSPLTDLDGFRIYYGELSGAYTDQVAVADGGLTRYDLTLPSGSYYVAMTALDTDGNESAYSNEVVKVVN